MVDIFRDFSFVTNKSKAKISYKDLAAIKR